MYKPKTATEPFNELYCEAVHKLPYQRYKCDMLQIALENHNGRWDKVKRADERARKNYYIYPLSKQWQNRGKKRAEMY